MPIPVTTARTSSAKFVATECGGFAVLAHLRQGSVLVTAGQEVALGEPLDEVGNSGNSSEPHLQIHARRGIPDAAPLGLTIDGQLLVRHDRVTVP